MIKKWLDKKRLEDERYNAEQFELFKIQHKRALKEASASLESEVLKMEQKDCPITKCKCSRNCALFLGGEAKAFQQVNNCTNNIESCPDIKKPRCGLMAKNT